MPNHVTNKLTISGSKKQLDAFEAEFIALSPSSPESEVVAFSFEQFIPMPPILRRVVETTGAKQVYDDSVRGCARPATDAEIAEITATGYGGWYSWSIAHWGTKWDCYNQGWERTSDTEAVLKFVTAWSCPEPVFAAMASHDTIAPLHINISAFDEGWNFAFRGEISGGTYEGNSVEADDEIYEEVYGYAPEKEDEE